MILRNRVAAQMNRRHVLGVAPNRSPTVLADAVAQLALSTSRAPQALLFCRCRTERPTVSRRAYRPDSA